MSYSWFCTITRCNINDPQCIKREMPFLFTSNFVPYNHHEFRREYKSNLFSSSSSLTFFISFNDWFSENVERIILLKATDGLCIPTERCGSRCRRRDSGCPRGARIGSLPLWQEEGEAKGIPECLRKWESPDTPRPELSEDEVICEEAPTKLKQMTIRYVWMTACFLLNSNVHGVEIESLKLF